MLLKDDLKNLADEIQRLKSAADNLNQMADDFPALNRNLVRILAGIKMLELNISDVVALEKTDPPS